MQVEILRLLRSVKNVKQEAIASFLEMSQANYSDLENGKRKISSIIAEKLAAFYGVNKETFLPVMPSLKSNDDMIYSQSSVDSDKEMFQKIITRAESLVKMLEAEKKELASERREIFELLNKLADTLKSSRAS